MVRCTTDDDTSCDPFEFEADDEPINHGLPVYEEQNKVPYTKGTVSPPPGSSAAALVNGRCDAPPTRMCERSTTQGVCLGRYQLGSTIGKGNDGTVRHCFAWAVLNALLGRSCVR